MDGRERLLCSEPFGHGPKDRSGISYQVAGSEVHIAFPNHLHADRFAEWCVGRGRPQIKDQGTSAGAGRRADYHREAECLASGFGPGR